MCDTREVARIPVEDRSAFVAIHHILSKMETADTCPDCSMYLARPDLPGCICEKIKPLIEDGDLLPHSLHLYMHYREFRRMSNTGKLLVHSFPERVKMYISCIPEEERDLRRDLSDEAGNLLPNACILYPSDDSIPIADFIANLRKQSGLPPDAPAPGLRLVLLDGTWDQARSLLRQNPVPELPRVNVDTCLQRSLFDPARRQPMEGRMCTVEAAALALEAAGVDPRFWEPLYDRLREAGPSALGLALSRALSPSVRPSAAPKPKPKQQGNGVESEAEAEAEAGGPADGNGLAGSGASSSSAEAEGSGAGSGAGGSGPGSTSGAGGGTEGSGSGAGAGAGTGTGQGSRASSSLAGASPTGSRAFSGDIAAILAAMGIAVPGPAPQKEEEEEEEEGEEGGEEGGGREGEEEESLAPAREALRLFYSSPFRPGGAFACAENSGKGAARKPGGCSCCGDEIHAAEGPGAKAGAPEAGAEAGAEAGGEGELEGDRFVREQGEAWY
eukprot:tig00000056_g24079.t1